KFCDDYCRNAFNNKRNSDQNNLVRNINNTLRKNRRILAAHIPANEEMGRVTKTQLMNEGFNFTFHTHTYKTAKEQTYFFNYEYGYLPLDIVGFLVVIRTIKSKNL